ncbi:MAG: thioredoxin domain-containing protein, partial [Candidatus Marinimicrobia bacterium CG_4_10_14_0_2_um_filter_48_9]
MIDSYTNGLIHETSPYLKQHAHNPVEWYAWGETAFHRATQEDKPIFLSIGYSTCHWCHVMAHESFEDSSIADYLNRHFISIKVDREERPDIDQIYMSVCQSMTGSGGWPLTIVMTPEKKPFFAGTYFPNESRGGRIGLQDLLVRIHEVWVNQRAEIDQTTTEIVNSLRLAQSSAPGPALSIEMAGVAATEMADHFDPEFGGFREAPKFPGPHNLLFLLQHTHLTGDPTFQAMALKTLTEMRLGGLYDQVGGGFHRYSTDRKWHLPHFEKMLYDQALLLMAYADAYSISGDDLYRRTIVDTISYITRDLGAESGGFYSAEDADSDGGEGKFYTWTTAEISQIVTPERFRQLRDDFSLADSGNFLDEHAHHSTGLNILHLATTPEKLADRFHISTEQWWEDWNRDRDALRQAREKRVRPGLDNKI